MCIESFNCYIRVRKKINLNLQFYQKKMNLQDKIAKLCLDKYNSLKKTGKPTENEWTVLSGVVLENNFEELSVVSLCTGTKCLSGVQLRKMKYQDRGDRLSDSHAEILARRAFLRYLYSQLELISTGIKSEVFYLENNDVKLHDISFHFFSSQTPCGDCSIIPKTKNEVADECPAKKIKMDSENEIDSEFGEEIVDIHRTGAKCLENDEKQDPCGQGVGYHIVGPLRTKPGRGDRTLSLSCSDKMAKWNVMGVQGALLSTIIPLIHFKSIVIAGSCPFSLESMTRGLGERFDPNIKIPMIFQSTVPFQQRKGSSRIRPCPSSIIWCAVPTRSLEISVDGLKQGATKKKSKSCRLLISRKELFRTFLESYDNFSKAKENSSHPKKLTFYHCKQSSTFYQNLRREKKSIFLSWPTKPLYLQECLSF